MEQTTGLVPSAQWHMGRYRLAAIILLAVTATLLGLHALMGSNVASRMDVSDRMATLGPACRPIAAGMLHARIVEKRKPLTRREMDDMIAGLTDCQRMDEQMRGLGDG